MSDRLDSRPTKTRQWLLSGVSLVICGIALAIIFRKLRHFDGVIVLTQLQQLSWRQIVLALGLTGCSYGAIAQYDALAFHHLKRKIAWCKTAFAGLITYAISPNVGFAFLSGSMLRYRLYRQWRVPPLTIAQVIAFCNLGLWLGLLPMAGLVFISSDLPLPQGIALPWFGQSLRLFGGVCLCFSLLFGCCCLRLQRPWQWRGHTFQLPSLEVYSKQIVLCTLDWGFAALALYALLAPNQTFFHFFMIYVLAMVAGLLSTVPGGLGIFETVVLFFLQGAQSQESILATLIVFRGLYYFLPFAIAVMALVWFESRQSYSA